MKKFNKNLKILHVGNIANNAYLNSKFLRKSSFHSDVLCYDNFHIMSSPEWEESHCEGNYGDDFHPDWSKVNLEGFKLPKWFKRDYLENFGSSSRKVPTPHRKKTMIDSAAGIKNLLKKTAILVVKYPKLAKISEKFLFRTRYIFFYSQYLFRKILKPDSTSTKIQNEEIAHYRDLIREFKKIFPKRKDQLSLKDILPFRNKIRIFKKIFQKYDLIQGYSIDPIWPMLAGFRPYTAFEHGTIRELPFQDSAIGRLTALAYKKADAVFITNGDAISSAKKLGIKNFFGIPHPVDYPSKEKVPQKKKGEIVLFCPLRHDWKIKGTDKYLLALKKIKEKSLMNVKMILVQWGKEQDKSQELIQKLNLQDNVEWHQPMPKKTLVSWIQKADIICDQIALPHLGGTAPLALSCGKPILMSYKPESTRWLFDEDAPIIPVFNEKEVITEILKLIKNPKRRKKIGKQGERWFAKYHSPQVVTQVLLKAYSFVLKEKNES